MAKLLITAEHPAQHHAKYGVEVGTEYEYTPGYLNGSGVFQYPILNGTRCTNPGYWSKEEKNLYNQYRKGLGGTGSSPKSRTINSEILDRLKDVLKNNLKGKELFEAIMALNQLKNDELSTVIMQYENLLSEEDWSFFADKM